MTGKSVKQFALGCVGCNVANQPTFGCVRSEFFQASLKVLHGSTGGSLQHSWSPLARIIEPGNLGNK